MKRPEHFEEKRRRRDKAFKRFIKNRRMIIPSLILVLSMGATFGGLVGIAAQAAVGRDAVPIGLIVGGLAGIVFGGPYVLRRLEAKA